MNASLQAVLPIGDVYVICGLNLCLVEYAVVRTCSWGGVFGSMQRPHATSGDAGQPMNRLCEIIPRADALVGEVIDARLHTLVDGREDGCGKVMCIGGRSYLVKDNTQFRLLAPQPAGVA